MALSLLALLVVQVIQPLLHYVHVLFAYLASVMSVGEGAANCNIVLALVVSNAQCNGILVVRYLSRPSYVLVLKTLLCLPASIC